MLFPCAVFGSGQITRDEAVSKFVAAGTAYKEGKYADAARLYNDILQGGRESGAVYYNLGNAYYKIGDVGKAVLSYERAGSLIPRDRDLDFNYPYALSKVDQYQEDKGNLLIQMVNRHVQFYTRDEMVVVMTCAVFFAGVFFLLSLYLNWPRPVTRGVTVLLLFVFAVYGAGLAAKVLSEKGLAVVVAAGDAYFEPREESTTHFKLPEGTKVNILKTEGPWLKIRRLDGKVGWALQKNLEEISSKLRGR
jgi:tetratricopeptide (TPR) repeat protein